MGKDTDSFERGMTPRKAFRAIGRSSKVLLPTSAVALIIYGVFTYFRDQALERLRNVETAQGEERKQIADHEGRLIRAETQAEASREATKRIEAAIETMSQKLDRAIERRP